MSKTHTIVVLSDGETWNTLSGCSILVINDKQFDDLCNDRIDAGDLKPIAEIGLADQTPPQDDDIDDEIADFNNNHGQDDQIVRADDEGDEYSDPVNLTDSHLAKWLEGVADGQGFGVEWMDECVIREAVRRLREKGGK